MREEFLHYVWQFQKYNRQHLQTTDGRVLQIIKVGQPNHDAGPDFSMAEILLEQERWFGQVEIHIKSSDWLQHGHQRDPNYNGVILHVVWEHNEEIRLPNGGSLPVFELRGRVPSILLEKFERLMRPTGSFIPCENEMAFVPELLMKKWLERLFLERLEKKCTQLKEWLEQTNYHWEAVCFFALAKVFGMKVNAQSFVSAARSVDFKILQKCRSHPVVLEALLMGQAGMLEEKRMDPYYQSLQATYRYLIHKFKIEQNGIVRPQYFRLRPNNFPTIRFSQLAVLWSSIPNFVSCIRSIHTKEQAYSLFSVAASHYWTTHYCFGKETKNMPKSLSKAFIDLILINVVLPFQLLYGKQHGNLEWQKLEALACEIHLEKNKIVSQFQGLTYLEDHAWNGQALIELHQNYCTGFRCTRCMIGHFLLKS